jgi:hypothetical protein
MEGYRPPLPVAIAADAPVADAPKTPKSCVDDGAPYDLAVLRARVEHLASKQLDGRVPGSEGDRVTRAFAVELFTCLGLAPVGSGYEHAFKAEGKATANVVGVIRGSDPELREELIFVGAHHDHEGNGHLGANDNASGVVGLLAVAQAIQQRGETPKRTIVFALFGGEELGMLGSNHLAAHPPEGLSADKVVQFINLDMIGSHAAKGYVAALGAFSKVAARKPLAQLVKRYPKLQVAMGGRARGSDFLPYCERGVPYVFFWTPDPKCYHRECDTADRLDYARMADIARLAEELVVELADSEADLKGARARGCSG